MRGSRIIATADPRGRRDEGTIADTSKPGTVMEVVPATAPVQGRFSYRCRQTGADGAAGPIIVLLENFIFGKIYSDAYAANERGFLYWPEPGDEVNMLLKDLAGTSDPAIAVGDLFGIKSSASAGTGGLILRNSSFTAKPFEAMEAYTAGQLSDLWVWTRYRGDQA